MMESFVVDHSLFKLFLDDDFISKQAYFIGCV